MSIVRSIKTWSYPSRYRLAAAVFPAAKRFGPGARASFSAAGEDLIAMAWLGLAGIPPSAVRYLDIGAADPIELNNTYLFSTHGGSGVLVEPDPDRTRKLRTRTRDTVVNVGVAFDQRRSATLTRFRSKFFNTFFDDQSDAVCRQSADWAEPQSVVDRIEVPLMPINAIIETHLSGISPDFLSIDAEGADFAILQSLDLSRFTPTVICAECMRPLGEFESLLGPHGYQLVCRTPDNVIFFRPTL